jgi:hypothetical protein
MFTDVLKIRSDARYANGRNVDTYRIGKSIARTQEREAAGRWGGRGDQRAKNAIALAEWKAGYQGIEVAPASGDLASYSSYSPASYSEVEAVGIPTPAPASGDVGNEAEEARQAKLAARRVKDRARREALKQGAV